MVQKIEKICLNEILYRSLKGKKVYKIVEEREPFVNSDFRIEAIVADDERIRFYKKELSFYGYERQDAVSFDKDGHPYWKASFGQDSFKLYDGIFLGRFGCGGFDLYCDSLSAVYQELKKRKSYLSDEFNKFYSSIKEEEAAALLGEFGLSAKSSKSSKIEISIDDSLTKREKVLIAFGQWYRKIIDKNGAYKAKIKNVTPKEHAKAFRTHVNRIVDKLEKAGFEKVE